MSDWWKSLTHKEKIVLIVAIIGAIGGISIVFNVDNSTGDSTTQATNGGDAIIHGGTGDISTGDHIQQQTINIGLTIEQHEQRLKLRETEVRTQLEHTHAKDRQVLELELSDIQQKLQNRTASYENYLEKGCILLGSRIETPIEVKKGVCFLNKNKNYQSDIRMIARNAIIYLNYTGKEITCFLGDTCSFGWPNSPKFHVNSSGYPDEKMYISNAD